MTNITKEIQQLINSLNSEDPEVRGEAALDIAYFASEQDVEAISEYLETPNSKQDVKGMLILTLGKTKSKEAITSLKKYLTDEDFEIRWVTVQALGEISSSDAIQLLGEHFAQENVWNVRASIVKSLAKLAKIAPYEALKAIEQARTDKNYFVKAEADYVLNNNPSLGVLEIVKELVEKKGISKPTIEERARTWISQSWLDDVNKLVKTIQNGFHKQVDYLLAVLIIFQNALEEKPQMFLNLRSSSNKIDESKKAEELGGERQELKEALLKKFGIFPEQDAQEIWQHPTIKDLLDRFKNEYLGGRELEKPEELIKELKAIREEENPQSWNRLAAKELVKQIEANGLNVTKDDPELSELAKEIIETLGKLAQENFE